jgi:hypothetical protein
MSILKVVLRLGIWQPTGRALGIVSGDAARGPSVWLLQRGGFQQASLLLLRFQSKNWAFECQAVPRSELIHTPDNPKKREKMV